MNTKIKQITRTYWRPIFFKYKIFYQPELHRHRKHVLITERTVNTETIQTTISDHFTVTAKVPAIWKESKSRNIPLARNLNRLKGESALNFVFLLDQKL